MQVEALAAAASQLVALLVVTCAATAAQLQPQQPLNAAQSSKPNYLETGRQITGILDRFMSLGYDKRVRPNYGGPPVEVNVTMRILSISSVSEVMMDFTADFYFRQTWHDPRLSFKKLGDIQTLYVGAEVSKKIWLPDTFFGNEKLAYFHEATTPNVFLRIDHSGEVYRSIRLTVTSSCPMNLQYFPMDRQRCTIEAESYGYNVKDIIYRWARKDTAVERDEEISLPQFDIVQTVQKYRLEELSSGTYSRLIAELHFARRMGYYLIQIYIPSLLIVVISWVSFWLHRNASPARVQLGVTTVLTMTTLMSSTNAALPKVSYVKSIDIFLGTCFVMVFAALLEYATVGYLGKRIAMRKAQAQRAASHAQARVLAQLQAQGDSDAAATLAAKAALAAAAAGNGLDSTTAAAQDAATAALLAQHSAQEGSPLVFGSEQAAFQPALLQVAPQFLQQLQPVKLSSCGHALAGQQPPGPPPVPPARTSSSGGGQCCSTMAAAKAANKSARNIDVEADADDDEDDDADSESDDCRAARTCPHGGPATTCSTLRQSSPSCTCAGRDALCSVSLPRNATLLAATAGGKQVGCCCGGGARHQCATRQCNCQQHNCHKHENSTRHHSRRCNCGQHNRHHQHKHQTAANCCAARQCEQQLPALQFHGVGLQAPSRLQQQQPATTFSSFMSQPSKGVAAAATAAAATFINLHRRTQGLPPSTNPNFAQFSPLSGATYNRAVETVFGIRPSDIDKYSRVVFPVCFVCFQLMYWIVYLHISAFLDPDQQLQQNQPTVPSQPQAPPNNVSSIIS